MKIFLTVVTPLFCICSCLQKPWTESTSLLWKITGKGLDQPSYLFGTYHTMPFYFIDSIHGFYKAFDAVDVYVAEMNPFSTPNISVLERVKLPPDTTYKDLLNDSDLYLLDSVLNEYMNVSVHQMNLRPPHLNLILTQIFFQKREAQIISNKFLLDVSQREGIDAYLWKLAKINNMDLVQLETQSNREEWGTSDMKAFGFFDGNIEYQAKELIETIKAFGSDSIIKLAIQLRLNVKQAYYEQNLIKLEEALSKIDEFGIEYPLEYDDIRNKNRNVFWMKKIPQIIQSKPTFIAVGAGHLIGENSLINLLRKDGYDVEPVLNELNIINN